MNKVLVLDKFVDKVSKKAPIFIYLGNEGPIEGFYDSATTLTDDLGVAANFSALVVFAEHRFYGTSLPVAEADLFKNNQTLAYLTVEQAMMDFVKVI
jgi:hypothetical protein